MKRTKAAIRPDIEEEEIFHFDMGARTLSLHPINGTLAALTAEENRPSMLREVYFTRAELAVLVPLLEAFPYYCPYEILYTSLASFGRVTEQMVVRNRKKLQEAMDLRAWDQEMRPVRNVLSRTRLKLRPFNIEISSILETGYILMDLEMKLEHHYGQ